MGTTLTAALFHGEQMSICHVGDSRAYLYRDGRARQLTEDHSWIQEQVRAGLISPEDAMVSRFRNIITRSVGFEPDGGARPARRCRSRRATASCCARTDCPTTSRREEIGQALTAPVLRGGRQALIDMANERGGDDNITCVIVYAGNEIGNLAQRRAGAYSVWEASGVRPQASAKCSRSVGTVPIRPPRALS